MKTAASADTAKDNAKYMVPVVRSTFQILEVTCVAAPIWNADGEAAAAISISGPASRFNPR